jgi:subtilisin family serine protease
MIIRRQIFAALLTLMLILNLALPVLAAPSRAPSGMPLPDDPEPVIEPELKAQFMVEEEAGYMIQFRSQPNLSLAFELDWETRGRFVVNSLQFRADKSQERVRAYLDLRGVDYQAFWINNSILVSASDQTTFSGLLNFVEIDSLRARRRPTLHEPVASAPAQDVNASGLEANIARLAADQVWSQGYNGADIIVANIDTGVNYLHPALVDQYRGNLGEGEFDHNYNWWDPAIGGSDSVPNDWHGHGSHTMGIMVGAVAEANEADGESNQIGMAPGAAWIACQAFEGNDAELLECGQFLLAPWDLNGQNPDPSKRPHIINNSWGDCVQYLDTWYLGMVESWLAAGIYPVFSNGNTSSCGYATPPGLNTVGNPARYGLVTGVGSTGHHNGLYASHSNWGPTDDPDIVNPNGSPNLKPQVVAPGVNIRSADKSGDDYRLLSGTSMSAPHVSGLVALMWDAAACLIGEVVATESIIQATANPVLYDDGTGNGARSPNYATGWGEINAPAAVQAGRDYCGADFRLDAAPEEVSICAPEVALYDIDIDPITGYNQPVSLSLGTELPGAALSFVPNPALPLEGSVLRISSSSQIPAGSYAVDIVGISGSLVHNDLVVLNVYQDIPQVPTLSTPLDGADAISVTPSFSWSSLEQSTYYRLEVSIDVAFEQIVYAVDVQEASHSIPTWLKHNQEYYWRVSAGNDCGLSTPQVARFSTKSPAAILLVDDDDNSPDVSAYYQDSLDALDLDYDLWNTWNSDDEPPADRLAPFEVAIWFVGDEWQDAAGPGNEAEIALASWLEKGNCLIINGQDYLWNRGVTGFVSEYLGLSDFENDLKHESVTGVGQAFEGLGVYSLSYPFFNFSDVLTPGPSAVAILEGDQGTAGLAVANGIFKTSLWGFPFEALALPAEREELLSAAINWCLAEGETYEIYLPLIER